MNVWKVYCTLLLSVQCTVHSHYYCQYNVHSHYYCQYNVHSHYYCQYSVLYTHTITVTTVYCALSLLLSVQCTLSLLLSIQCTAKCSHSFLITESTVYCTSTSLQLVHSPVESGPLICYPLRTCYTMRKG